MKSNKILATVSVGALMGCTQFGGVMAPADPGATPTAARGRGAAQPPVAASRVRSGAVEDLGEMYRQGREAQEAQRLSAAEQQYARILSIDPRHVDALNALGVLRARAGQLEQAQALFSRAIAAAPGKSAAWNNRGYALLLAARLDDAEADFQNALALEPDNDRARGNLMQLAQARATQAELAAATQTQTSGQLVAVAPQVYELRDQPASSTLAEQGHNAGTAPAQGGAAPLLAGVRLEVSNGVGIRRMAWRTAKQLEALGTVTARLSNQPGYRQRVTEIQYRAGYQQAAHDLAARLPGTPPARQASLAPQVQVRLVLGHDLVGREVAKHRVEGSSEDAPAALASGWLLA
jgi:tetratricopeptide (TPR) repeat protein